MQIEVNGKSYNVNISLGTFRVIKEIGLSVQRSGGTTKDIIKQADEIDELINYVIEKSVDPVPSDGETRTAVFNNLTSLTEKFIGSGLKRSKKLSTVPGQKSQ